MELLWCANTIFKPNLHGGFEFLQQLGIIRLSFTLHIHIDRYHRLVDLLDSVGEGQSPGYDVQTAATGIPNEKALLIRVASRADGALEAT